MAYKLYLDGVLFPVAPSKVTVKINNQNETVTLINEGEANILKAAGLSDVEFDLLLPNTEYPFALYPETFRNARFYLDKLEELKLQKKSFQYIMTRAFPNNKKLFHTNMTVSLEDYSIVDDAGEGFDTTVKIKLKQYREFITKTCTVDISLPKPQAAMQQTRAAGNRGIAFRQNQFCDRTQTLHDSECGPHFCDRQGRYFRTRKSGRADGEKGRLL